MEHISYKAPQFNSKEDYDPALGRLNSIDKLADYCDSVYLADTPGNPLEAKNSYPEVVNTVISKRFYHGYSQYGFRNNFMSMFLSQVSLEGLNAIVIPDDIMHFPYAACSQQSIVMMDVLKRKGFATRKVGFSGQQAGHFCFEVFYNNGWHFFDPNMEPDPKVLNALNRPGIEYLAKNQSVLLAAYKQHSSTLILDMMPNYTFGEVDAFAAPRAILFQKITKFLSYTIWLFFLGAFIWTRSKYKFAKTSVKKKKIPVPVIAQHTGLYPA